MKYDLTGLLNDHRDKPILNGDKQVTLGSALEQACISGGSQKPDADTKLRQFKLAQKISTNDSVELSSEDVTLLKSLADSIFSAIAYGAIVHALENPGFNPSKTAKEVTND